ncbi:MAG: cadherin-like domain-containing protein, partial [Ilumatobacteraceae bacterium]
MQWVASGQASITMTATIYIGLAVSAHSNSVKLATAVFDNVSISTPPNAAADSYSVNEDATLSVDALTGVLDNDADLEGDTLTAILVSGTAGLTLNADGSFTYVPPANFNGTASFTYVANDSTFNSAPATVTLVVDPANEVPSFTGGPNQISVSNLGARSIAGWATAITQGTGESGQLLEFIVTNNNNSLFSVQPTLSPDGTLSYASAGATGTAVVSVAIHDNGGTANGGVDTSAVQTFTITIDTPPVVTTTGAGLNYIENGTTVLDPGVTITDADSPNLISATVTMATNYVNGQDTLGFANQNGIVGTWTAATGILNLSGGATVSSYEAALRSITYTNNSRNPIVGLRTVTFVANDGVLVSDTATRTITITPVNDAPVVTATGTGLAYTEKSTTAVDSALTVADVDNANLASARVTMTTGYVSGEDSLSFATQAGISGTWNPATGIMTLFGSATVASYQAALRSI